MLKHRNMLGALVLVVLMAAFLAAAVYRDKGGAQDVRYIDFIGYLNEGRVTEAVLSDKATLSFRLKDDEAVYKTDNPRNQQLKEELLLLGVAVSETDSANFQAIVSVLFFAGAFYLLNRRSGVRSAMAVADASGMSGITFNDVAGNDEARESIAELVDFLKAPEKYQRYGARMPRGILFYGPPGTGKTLMARAVAGEAGVPFYAVSGSDFVQMYVGVGAGRIRELFKKARASEKAVIFIDEIDALGRKRSGTGNGGSDERDQTLNALLTEMSGFSGGEGIIVIAATNRPDTLDEALLRPGRFDRQVEIGLPDRAARERILACHAAGKPLADEVSLADIARDTVYFSGAMLENLLNEAAIEAAKAGEHKITKAVIERAYYIILAGNEKKERGGIQIRDREITAWHEAGHALISRLLSPEASVTRVSIIPSSKGAGGFCASIPPDRLYRTKKELEAQVMMSLGGRAAEQLKFGGDSVTTGAAGDIEKANKIVRDYVTKYGMSEKIGLLRSEDTKATDGECGALLSQLYNETVNILTENQDILNAIAEELLAKELLNSAELEEIISGGLAKELR